MTYLTREEQEEFAVPKFQGKQTSNRLVRIVFDTNLSASHNGLSIVAKKLGLDLNMLGAGEFVLFVNKRQTMVKMFASGAQMLAHYKTRNNHRLNLKVLRILPRYFSGGELKYDEALRELIEDGVRH